MKKNEIRNLVVLSFLLFVAVMLLVPSTPKAVAYVKDTPLIREVEGDGEWHPYIPTASSEQIAETCSVKAFAGVGGFSESSSASYRLKATDEEKDLMARVVMSEASLLNFDGKCAVANTIVNRVLSNKFPNTIEEVIYQRYQYSTADNGDPDASCYDAVEAALTYEQFPTDMFYFRTGHYHSFADDYCQIGNTYFSTERKN